MTELDISLLRPTASYLPLIKHIRTLLSAHQKKSYTISVGKLNPAKLANFLEIECYVLVACPENSLIDAKEFYQPIVTPYELEVALGVGGRSWDGKYVLEFDQILRESGKFTSGEYMYDGNVWGSKGTYIPSRRGVKSDSGGGRGCIFR